jgi:hypothetical protein
MYCFSYFLRYTGYFTCDHEPELKMQPTIHLQIKAGRGPGFKCKCIVSVGVIITRDIIFLHCESVFNCRRFCDSSLSLASSNWIVLQRHPFVISYKTLICQFRRLVLHNYSREANNSEIMNT